MSGENKDGGGPAFPAIATREDGLRSYHGAIQGMTLRDWFAGKALSWCLAEFGGNAEDQTQPAEAAYQIADTMLAERKR